MGEPIECQNGTWSQIPRCVAARCKTMPTPPHNGMIVAPSLNHGATGLYTCKVGPGASNEGLRIFHNHGEGLQGDCEPSFEALVSPQPQRQCCGVDIPQRKTLITAAASICVRVTICHASCQDGFELRGEEKTTCVYGNWSGLTPSCQEQYCSFPGYLDNGKVGGATLLL